MSFIRIEKPDQQEVVEKIALNDKDSFSLSDIAKFCNETTEAFKSIGNALYWIGYYIVHPLELLANLWHWLVSVSTDVAVISITVLILYYAVTKSDKTSRWIGCIVVSYLLIQAVNSYI